MLTVARNKGMGAMAAIDVGAALGSGFGLIRRRPGLVLMWGLAQVVMFLPILAILGTFYLSLFGQIAANGPQSLASPEALQAFNAQMLGIQGPMFLMDLVVIFTSMILYCAVFRALIAPEERRFAYLRVGAAELFLFVLYFGFIIGLVAAILLGAVAVGVVVAILFVVHAQVAGVLLCVLAALIALVAMVWVLLRFSMVGPMMVADREFRFLESWQLTRGHAGDLFLIALGIIVILIVGEMILVGVFLTVGVGVVLTAAGGADHVEAFMARPGAALAPLAPVLVGGAILAIPLAGCVRTIAAAPWARAYLDLIRPTSPDGGAPA